MVDNNNRHYSNEHMLDMVAIWGECRRDLRQAAQLYAQRYPDRRHPANSTFHRLAENLKNHGGFKKTNARNRRHRQPDVVETVRRAVTENPHTSVRAVAADSGVCKSVVHDVLKHYLKWRPWKRHTTHKLTPNDFGRRENFCDWIAERVSLILYSYLNKRQG